jgi:hypothetical protein
VQGEKVARGRDLGQEKTAGVTAHTVGTIGLKNAFLGSRYLRRPAAALADRYEKMTAQFDDRDAMIGSGVCRRFAVRVTLAVLTTAISLLAASQTAAQTQDSPGYFGPIRFQRQVFTNIRPQPIRIPNQRFSTIPRQTIPPAPFTRDPIVIPQITRTRIPRETFVYSSSIFGPIDGVKAGQAAQQTQTRPQPTQILEPYRSRSIRPLSR